MVTMEETVPTVICQFLSNSDACENLLATAMKNKK